MERRAEQSRGEEIRKQIRQDRSMRGTRNRKKNQNSGNKLVAEMTRNGDQIKACI